MRTTTLTIKNSLFILIAASRVLAAASEHYITLEEHRFHHRVHAYRDGLRRLVEECTSLAQKTALAAGLCALARNDFAQTLPAFSQLGQMKQVDEDFEIFEKNSGTMEDRLFIEMRLFAYRPKNYGQSFGKSLLALEGLKRLAPRTPNLDLYEQEIRFLQGKQTEDPPSESEKAVFLSKESFGWGFGFSYAPPMGGAAALSYHDDRINDGPWGVGIGATVATIPRLDLNGRVGYRSDDYQLVAEGQFGAGREPYYGVGVATDLGDRVDWQVQRAGVTALYTQDLSDGLSAAVGIRAREVRATDPVSLESSALGPYFQLTLNQLDQIVSPRRGYRFETYGHLHRFQEFGLSLQLALPIATTSHVVVGSSLETQFGNVPQFQHLRLGGNFRVPGVPSFRFQDRSVSSHWLEFRQGLSQGLAGGVFGSVNFVGTAIDELIKHRSLCGGGAFLEWYWTRTSQANTRLELYRFVDQTAIVVAASTKL